MKKYNITYDELFDLFITKNMTRKEVSIHFGCSEVLIKKKCNEYGIKKPKNLENQNKERKLDKECVHCKNIFKVIQCRNSGKWEMKYCSHKCSSRSRFLGLEHKRKVLNCIAAKRRANMRNATVELNEEQQNKIKDMYLNCPKGHEVDHIKPISKNGKHHPDNLQILTRTENRKKYNKCSET